MISELPLCLKSVIPHHESYLEVHNILLNHVAPYLIPELVRFDNLLAVQSRYVAY